MTQDDATPIAPLSSDSSKKINGRAYWRRNKDAINSRRRAAYHQNKAKYQLRNHMNYLKHREKRLAKTAEWVKANPDKVKLIKARYRDSHRDELREKGRQYSNERWAKYPEEMRAKARLLYAMKREYLAAYARMWRALNRTAFNAWQRARRAANPDYDRAWRQAHPEASRIKEQRRRTRKAQAAIIDLTTEQWQEILIAYNFRCVYCPPTCSLCRRKKHKLTQDHLTPVSKGGNYTVHNIVPACQSCNTRKGAKDVPTPVQPLLLTVAPSAK